MDGGRLRRPPRIYYQLHTPKMKNMKKKNLKHMQKIQIIHQRKNTKALILITSICIPPVPPSRSGYHIEDWQRSLHRIHSAQAFWADAPSLRILTSRSDRRMCDE